MTGGETYWDQTGVLPETFVSTMTVDQSQQAIYAPCAFDLAATLKVKA